MADEDVPHSEASSGASFKNFWRLKDKISGKGVKFTPNITNPADEIKHQNPTDAVTQKQHRRAQVRKAQIEHRQRKKNYVKHLEQDIIQLRDKIAVAEAESNLIREENTAIKDTLSKAQVPSTIESNRLSTNFLLPAASPDFLSSQTFGWPSSDSSSCTQVSVDFDALMQADCLHINRAKSFGERYNQQPIQECAQLTGNNHHHEAEQLQTDVSSPIPEHPSLTFQCMAPSQSDIAVNFILALEYPCRTHFRHVPPTTTPFDPDAPATGHELMASTLLYSHAPYTPIPKEETQTPAQDYQLTSKTWTAPDLPLSKLYAMSLSLPKEDFEITPVQAWFLLTEKYRVEWLLKEGRLEKLKAELRELVKCWDFGAVINIALFWEVVQNTLGS